MKCNRLILMMVFFLYRMCHTNRVRVLMSGFCGLFFFFFSPHELFTRTCIVKYALLSGEPCIQSKIDSTDRMLSHPHSSHLLRQSYFTIIIMALLYNSLYGRGSGRRSRFSVQNRHCWGMKSLEEILVNKKSIILHVIIPHLEWHFFNNICPLWEN